MASKGQREMPPKDLKVVLLLVALNLLLTCSTLSLGSIANFVDVWSHWMTLWSSRQGGGLAAATVECVGGQHSAQLLNAEA